MYFALTLLIATACAALVLSQRVSSRQIGFGAALAVFGAAALLFLPTPNVYWIWSSFMDVQARIAPALAGERLQFALTLLAGGGLVILLLAHSLDPTLRGFGALVAWIVLALLATLALLASDPALLPLLWGAAVIGCHLAVRSSGAINQRNEPPYGLVFGLLATILLTLGVVSIDVVQRAVADGLPPPLPLWPALVAIVLAALMALGSAPFHRSLDELSAAPALVGVIGYGLVMPILVFGTLLRLAPLIVVLPAAATLWRWSLVTAGVVGMLSSAVGALGAQRLRQLVVWQMSVQAGAGLVALGLGVTNSAPLVINLALSTLAAALAVQDIERQTGSDDYTTTHLAGDLRVAGTIWALAAVAALGLPPFYGFWGRMQLFDAALAVAPWVAPLVMVASLFAALAWLAPLGFCWRYGGSTDQPRPSPWAFVPLLALLPLLVTGAVPQLVGLAAPSVTLYIGVTSVALLLVLIGVALNRIATARRLVSDPDMVPVRFAPSALAEGLAPLGWLAGMRSLGTRSWWLLQLASQGVHMAMTIFEQRFYLAGVMIVVISIMFMMAR